MLTLLILIITGYAVFKKYRVKHRLKSYFSSVQNCDWIKFQNNYNLVQDINEISEHAECPYGDGNIQNTFYQAEIVKCNRCGAFHHKDCFDRFGKCGSFYCMGK